METVTLYRVENEFERGPYRGMGGVASMANAHWDDDHPSPWADKGLEGIQDDEVCALRSLEEIAEWFKGYGEALHEHGFTLNKVIVPAKHVRYGRGQAVFTDDEGSRVESMDIRKVVA